VFLIISQSITLPVGINTVETSAWVRGQRDPGDPDDTVFILTVDGNQCGYASTYANNDWVQITCRVGVSATADGKHELSMQVSSIGSFGVSGSFGIDDFVFRPVV